MDRELTRRGCRRPAVVVLFPYRPSLPAMLCRPGRGPPPCGHEGRHAIANLVPNPSYLAGRPPFRIGQPPVVALQTAHVRARFATAHGDEQRCTTCELVGQLLWPLRT